MYLASHRYLNLQWCRLDRKGEDNKKILGFLLKKTASEQISFTDEVTAVTD